MSGSGEIMVVVAVAAKLSRRYCWVCGCQGGESGVTVGLDGGGSRRLECDVVAAMEAMLSTTARE